MYTNTKQKHVLYKNSMKIYILDHSYYMKLTSEDSLPEYL